MAFVPEDGTGLTNSNSFASVEYADAYFVDRGDATWAGFAVASKQALLIRATDVLVLIYDGHWVGDKLTSTQALPWPRTSVPAYPIALQNAVVELALYMNTADPFAVPKPTSEGLFASSQKKIVGPITTETKFKNSGFGSAPQIVMPPKVTNLLRPIIVVTTTARVIR